MSELRVALVAEGPTDAIVIEAALKALLEEPFELTLLQPEATRQQLGAGWGGVLRWCQDFAGRGHSDLESDPTLPGFDLFIVHVDADVAEGKYGDVSVEIATLADQRGWPPLPCKVPCPPPTTSADEIRCRILAWLGLAALGSRTVLCVPSKASEAWLTAALFQGNHRLLRNLECNLNLEAQLAALPKRNGRVKKSMRNYRDCERRVTGAWDAVRNRCTQADRFSNEVSAVIS